MFVTFESTIGQPKVLATFATFEEAFSAMAEDAFFIEEDADNAGCADAFMKDGTLRCIEPAARRGL